jgi:hypothetical protein
MKTDDWFKPVMVILAIVFLIIFYGYSQNGRYALTKFSDDLSMIAMVDSRTGTLYFKGSGKVVKVDYPRAKITISSVQNNDTTTK